LRDRGDEVILGHGKARQLLDIEAPPHARSGSLEAEARRLPVDDLLREQLEAPRCRYCIPGGDMRV
jgi:hypothetical protein